MLSSTVRICSAGLHLSFKISRQMRPAPAARAAGVRAVPATGAAAGAAGGARTKFVHVWMVDVREESNLRRRHRVILRQEQLHLEHAACAHSAAVTRAVRERRGARGVRGMCKAAGAGYRHKATVPAPR